MEEVGCLCYNGKCEMMVVLQNGLRNILRNRTDTEENHNAF